MWSVLKKEGKELSDWKWVVKRIEPYLELVHYCVGSGKPYYKMVAFPKKTSPPTYCKQFSQGENHFSSSS